jgi:hypothetical protein
MAVKFSGLGAGRTLITKNILYFVVLISVSDWVNPMAIVRPKIVSYIENFQ